MEIKKCNACGLYYPSNYDHQCDIATVLAVRGERIMKHSLKSQGLRPDWDEEVGP